MKRLLMSGIAGVLMFAQAAGAQPASDTKATLTIFQWINPQIIESTDRAKERFKLKYPNVTVETQFVPQPSWGEYNSAMLNQVASGGTPDIFASAIEGFSEIASKGLLRDLTLVIAGEPWGGEPVMQDGRVVGYLTSCAFGHRVGHCVALGYLNGPHADEATGFHVDVLGERREVRVRKAADFDPDGTRMRG